MTTYRRQLPQLTEGPFITDGGLETTLMFHHGFDLPEMAAFDVLGRPGGYDTLRDYFMSYIDLAMTWHAGILLESCTWRASRDWGAKLGYSPGDLRDINRQAIALLQELRTTTATDGGKLVVSGCIGPRGDGYSVGKTMTPAAAEQYHREQIDTLSRTEADLVSAYTINYTEEAIGITRAAQSAGMPVVISFTVETDGRLPSGQPLGAAVTAVDRATGNGPAYYMINCAHPTHFSDALAVDAPWVRRILAIRANASDKSHAELDGADTLDVGDPAELGARYAELRRRWPHLTVFGGCCGTDQRHLAKIAAAVAN